MHPYDDQRRRLPVRHGVIAGVLSIVACLAMGAGTSLATTTHPFIENITVANGGGVQPEAFDENGNMIVWLNQEHTVAKFDTNGNPVAFTGLGTNVLDGKGGFDCPTTAADCDRTQTNGFGDFSSIQDYSPYKAVAVDDSGGPANGYIYVQNNHGCPFQCNGGGGEIDVFDSTGIFLGKIDQSQTFPDGGDGAEPSAGIWVDGQGVLYIDHYRFSSGSHVDRYVPVDGIPAHDQFSGQLRAGEASYQGVAVGEKYAYVYGQDRTHETIVYYMRFPQAEFHRQGLTNTSVSDTFPPDPGPFGNGGFYPQFNSGLPIVYVDPADEHVYIGDGWAGFKEFDPENHQVGPMFANDECPGNGPYPPGPACHIGAYGEVQSIAINRSGGPDEGHIYIHGTSSNKIAVFGPPAVIPDVEEIHADPLHSTAHVSAKVSLGGGPTATDCTFEYGPSAATEGQQSSEGYEFAIPCSPAAPYASDQDISVDISKLIVEATYHYRFVARNANGRNATADRQFVTHAVLGVSTDPATNLTGLTADLDGSLNPDGLDTHYRFEYGISTHYNNRTSLADAGSGTGLQSVAPLGISGLQAGRTYHYRLVANNSLGKTKGPDRTFVVPASPRISGVRATNLTDTSADINARVDSLTFATTYHFEYGTTPNYGHSTAETELSAGSGPQPVMEHISGLEAGVPYYYRVVATNSWGTTDSADSTFSFQAPGCPNSHVRQQTNASYLPDCRAYELVSPPNAGSVTFIPGDVTATSNLAKFLGITAPNPSGLASTPARFAFFGGEGSVTGLHPPNVLVDRYVSTRTNTGWQTTYPGIKGNEGLLVQNPVCSATLSRCIDSRGPNPFEEGAPPTGRYLWDVSGESLGRLPTNIGVIPNGENFIGDTHPSLDFSHFAFSSRNVAFTVGGLDSAPGSAYDNDLASGKVTLISKLANGDPIPQDAGQSDEFIKIPAVSSDGSHVLMTTVAAGGLQHIYMSVDDLVTEEIGEGNLVGMTSDGSTVAFTSPFNLDPSDTDNSVDLYVWSESTGNATVVSQGNGNGDVDTCGAFFTTGCDVKAVSTQRPDLDESMASQSGDVYFYSPEQLDPSNPGVFNERNLYVYRNGQVMYVTTFDPETQVDRMQVSPSGEHMAFLSKTQATGYVNISLDNGTKSDSQKPEAWEEMYTFDPESGEVLCASCIPSGEPPTIPVADTTRGASTTTKNVFASKSGRFMTNDGRVAFTSADSLVPADTNKRLDVYEFSGNRPQLITSGTSERDTQGGDGLFIPTLHTGLEGFSQDGTDLYFSTFETFVPEDQNGSFVKFYDARTGGGFPIQPPLLPCTAADECHGDSTSAPSEPSFATSANLGNGGHATTKKPGHKTKPRPKRKKHRRHDKHRGGSGNG
jgi:hypothetical protein